MVKFKLYFAISKLIDGLDTSKLPSAVLRVLSSIPSECHFKTPSGFSLCHLNPWFLQIIGLRYRAIKELQNRDH